MNEIFTKLLAFLITFIIGVYFFKLINYLFKNGGEKEKGLSEEMKRELELRRMERNCIYGDGKYTKQKIEELKNESMD